LATGNGAAIETVALQRAAADCEANGGGTIQLPAGTFLTGQFTLGSRCVLAGAGRDATTIKCVASEPNACIHASAGQKIATNASNYGNPVSHVEVRDLTLNANGTARIAGALGGYVRGLVVAHGSDHIVVRNVRFTD